MTLVGHHLYLETRDAADVIDRPSITAIDSYHGPLMSHANESTHAVEPLPISITAQLLGSGATQLPPRSQYPWAALNHWYAPTTEYPVQRAPLVLLQADSETETK